MRGRDARKDGQSAMSGTRAAHAMVDLDRISWRIVEELQADGRLSWAEVGRRVGLTTPATAERIRRLEELGVIRGYHAEIAPERLGVVMLVFIRLTVMGAGAGAENVVTRFLQAAKGWEELVECHRVTGSESFIWKARIVSVAHLEAFIDKVGQFGATSTSTVLSSPVQQRRLTEKALGEFERY
jgi:Lrp/AsnC family transcriptional regulator, leucine-responsive regulatory protein